MNTPSNFAELVSELLSIISLIVPLLFALTFVVIAWKIVSAWIINAGDSTKIEEGRQTVIVGVIALVIMSGVWGILAILQNSLF